MEIKHLAAFKEHFDVPRELKFEEGINKFVVATEYRRDMDSVEFIAGCRLAIELDIRFDAFCKGLSTQRVLTLKKSEAYDDGAVLYPTATIVEALNEIGVEVVIQ